MSLPLVPVRHRYEGVKQCNWLPMNQRKIVSILVLFFISNLKLFLVSTIHDLDFSYFVKIDPCSHLYRGAYHP